MACAAKEGKESLQSTQRSGQPKRMRDDGGAAEEGGGGRRKKRFGTVRDEEKA